VQQDEHRKSALEMQKPCCIQILSTTVTQCVFKFEHPAISSLQ